MWHLSLVGTFYLWLEPADQWRGCHVASIFGWDLRPGPRWGSHPAGPAPGGQRDGIQRPAPSGGLGMLSQRNGIHRMEAFRFRNTDRQSRLQFRRHGLTEYIWVSNSVLRGYMVLEWRWRG